MEERIEGRDDNLQAERSTSRDQGILGLDSFVGVREGTRVFLINGVSGEAARAKEQSMETSKRDGGERASSTSH